MQKLCAAYMWQDISNNDRAKLRKYAHDNFENTKWFVEKPNYSKLHFSERPMLQKAASWCASKNANFIMLNARLQKKIDGLTWLSQQTFDFHVVDMPSLNRDNLCHAIDFASDDVKIIAKKTRAALQQIKADIASGKAHISHAGNMISKLGAPDPSVANKSKSAKVLERTMCLYNSHLKDMRAEGLSYAAMADRLNRLGVSPPFNTVFDQELQQYITSKPGDAKHKIWGARSVMNYFLRGELNAEKNKTRIADEKGSG